MSGFERVLTLLALGVAACSGSQSAQAPAEDAAQRPPPIETPHGKRAPCATDQSCNEDPSVSALWGRCAGTGVCECNEGFERSPTSDLCRPIAVESSNAE